MQEVKISNSGIWAIFFAIIWLTFSVTISLGDIVSRLQCPVQQLLTNQ